MTNGCWKCWYDMQ